MPFSTMACARSARGTVSGVVAAQAGEFIAVPAPIAKVRVSSPQGPIAPEKVSSARIAPASAIQAWPVMR